MKIKIKLQLSFLAVAVIIGIGGAIVYFTVSDSITASIGSEAIFVNRGLLSSLDESIYYKIQETQELASDPRLAKAIITSNEDFSNLEDPNSYLNEKDQEWISQPKGTLSPFMTDIISNELSDILRQKSKFYESSYQFPVFSEIFLTNSYGANVAQTGKTSDYKQNDEEWWQVAKQSGIHIQDVSFDESANVFSIDISVRIEDEDGNFLGILKNVVNIKDVSTLIQSAKSNSQFDNTDFFLLKKNNGEIFSTNENLLKGIIDLFTESPIENQSGYFQYSLNSEKFITYSQSTGYSTYPGLGWKLIITNDSDEILKPLGQLASYVVILTFLLIVFSLIVGFILSNIIVNPIKELTNTSIELQKGNLHERAKIHGNDEITTLSKAFNKMTDSIVEKTGQLKLKEEIETSKDEFMSMVAHELKTPLTPIIGWCDALKDPDVLGKLNDEQIDAIQTIYSNAHRLERLIGDLLDIQRLEIGRMSFSKSEFEVSELMNQIIKNFEKVNKNPNISIINSTKGNFTLKSDRRRLEQVLTNLVNNSLDFLDKPNSKIEINAKSEKNLIIFSVSDNGKGIPKNKQSDIFKKFYQQDTSQRREHGGAGLGLAICKGIVDGMGGKMWFESTEGKGTTFYFSFKKE